MKNKKILVSLFIIVALVQLYIPAKMIFDSENILKTGVLYRFKVAPVDPNDPFRGKFISLRYTANVVEVANEKDWKEKDEVYVLLKTDTEGFAKIEAITKEIPKYTSDFLAATIDDVTGDGSNKVYLEYPFDRFYMEEAKAYDAEVAYNESLRNTELQKTYALVYVKNGEAVLDDIMIDGISIKEVVAKRNGQ